MASTSYGIWLHTDKMIRITSARVQEIRKTCKDVRGLNFWAEQDGKGHKVHGGGRHGRIEQLVNARCAEEAVARRLGTEACFKRDKRSRVDLVLSDGRRIEVKSTPIDKVGQTHQDRVRNAARRRGFVFQKSRNGRIVNPLFDPSHTHHARALEEYLCGMVTETCSNGDVCCYPCIWMVQMCKLTFRPMRRFDLKDKLAVYMS